MFKSVEHAISASYYMLSVPIYGKSGTQAIIEYMREHLDPNYKRGDNKDMSPHEWHAQAIYIAKLVEKTLGKNSPANHILNVQYAPIEVAAPSALELAKYLGLTQDALPVAADCILAGFRQEKKKNGIRKIADKYDLPKSNIDRFKHSIMTTLNAEKNKGYELLECVFLKAGLVLKEGN